MKEKLFILSAVFMLLVGSLFMNFNVKADNTEKATLIATRYEQWTNGTSQTGYDFFNIEFRNNNDVWFDLTLSNLRNIDNIINNAGEDKIFLLGETCELYITPFENETVYIDSNYNGAPYQPLNITADVLWVGYNAIFSFNEGVFQKETFLSDLSSYFPDFEYFWIIAYKKVSTSVSYENGYNVGYEDGKQDYGIFYDGEWLSANEYGVVELARGQIEGYDKGYIAGYNVARGKFGVQVGADFITATEYGSQRYTAGKEQWGLEIDGIWFTAEELQDMTYNSTRSEFGIYYNGEWLSATQYYNLMRQGGLDGMLGSVFGGISKVLNIELIDGIKLGAFVFIPLIFGLLAFIIGRRK